MFLDDTVMYKPRKVVLYSSLLNLSVCRVLVVLYVPLYHLFLRSLIIEPSGFMGLLFPNIHACFASDLWFRFMNRTYYMPYAILPLASQRAAGPARVIRFFFGWCGRLMRLMVRCASVAHFFVSSFYRYEYKTARISIISGVWYCS
jgi:hypothetical protein